MVDRFIHKATPSGMVMRITKPGIDANNDASPFVLSSEHDYLKRHVAGEIKLSSYKYQNDYTIYWGNIAFPALPYTPVVFYSTQIYHSQSSRRIVYPYDRPSSGIEGAWVNITDSRCLIAKNGLWFRADGPNVEFDLYVRYIVFKNRLI
ncbi:hypothetical protein [Pseudochrobactrum sp. MP213Fo]|uniref:hypothetical protein n=1 Tax=Pseudochrobactrum sp. MP213Fo TaxID=3022250 RepID=UPI003BA061A6